MAQEMRDWERRASERLIEMIEKVADLGRRVDAATEEIRRTRASNDGVVNDATRLPTPVIVAEARLHGWHSLADAVETAGSEEEIDDLIAGYRRILAPGEL